MMTWKRALLALPPLLGLMMIAWQGANRPERLILGKWQTGAPHESAPHVPADITRFHPDGTYKRTEWARIISCGPPSLPGEAPQPPQPVRWTQFQENGRYYFLTHGRLVMRPEDEGYDGRLNDLGLATGAEVIFRDGEARMAGAVWKRIE